MSALYSTAGSERGSDGLRVVRAFLIEEQKVVKEVLKRRAAAAAAPAK